MGGGVAILLMSTFCKFGTPPSEENDNTIKELRIKMSQVISMAWAYWFTSHRCHQIPEI